MSSFSIFVMEKPGCFVFGKCGKNILQDRDFLQYCQNYLENTYIGKGTKSFRKPPRLPLEILNVCVMQF